MNRTKSRLDQATTPPHKRSDVAAILVGLCLAFGWVPAARGEVLLIGGDLQSLVAATQPSWTAMGLDTDQTYPAVQTLPPTASGSAAGITATLNGGDQWVGRGLDRDRAAVFGTTFNDVVSDLWFNRQNSFTLTLNGLNVSTQYTVRAWHNDSYTINQGAAAGGGTVTPSLVGGTVQTAINGTVTNLYGSQTESSFGVTRLVFTPTGSTATVTMTRSGGSFAGVPVSGISLSTATPVPEPSAIAMLAAGAVAMGAGAIRRRRTPQQQVGTCRTVTG